MITEAKTVDIIEDLLKQMDTEGCIMHSEAVLTAQMYVTILKYRMSGGK